MAGVVARGIFLEMRQIRKTSGIEEAREREREREREK